MSDLDDTDKTLVAERAAETAKEGAYLGRVLAVYHNFNFATVTTPEILSWFAGLSALGGLVLGQNTWAILSGIAAALSALLLRIHKVQNCSEFQEQLAVRKSTFDGLAARYDAVGKRPDAYSVSAVSELEQELVEAKKLPPVVIRSLFGLIPQRDDN